MAIESASDGGLPVPPHALLDGASLFLDFDGTLVAIAERPDSVAVDATLRSLMQRLAARLDGRIAIISGRSVAQLAALFGELPFAVAGSHGLELRRVDGEVRRPMRPPGLDRVVDAMNDLAAAHTGLVVEDKALGAALHYRAAPDLAETARILAVRLAAEHGLDLQPGKMVFEVRAGGGDKGIALRALHADRAMAGTVPVFIGDDTTDEPGFAAAAELGGAGILVGPTRASAARFRLPDVPAALAWLDAASR